MGDPSDGLNRARRKSLVDIGHAMGVLSSSQTLPSGFELPISPLEEELHLTPRSMDVSPRSSSPSVETTSQGSAPPILDRSSLQNASKIDNTKRPKRRSLDTVMEATSSEADDGPVLDMDINSVPPRESVFEPELPLLEEIADSIQFRSSEPRIRSSAAPASSQKNEHVRSPSEDPRSNQRFTHLPSTVTYSSTTPNPRTSTSPLVTAFSFFSKLFTPQVEQVPSAASSSSAARTIARGTSRSHDPESSSSSPPAHNRTSTDLSRSPNEQGSIKILSTRPMYVGIEP
jgi:hypothetical protein